MKNRNILIFLFLILIAFYINGNDFSKEKFSSLPGSSVYIRIFLFFFPISDSFETLFTQEENSLINEITIKKDSIKNEPATPPIFETDLNIRIKDIPDKSGRYILPVTIRCNKKVNFNDVLFTVYRKGNILILKGYVNDLSINDISNNEYFKNRFKWKFPLYFDLRYTIE